MPTSRVTASKTVGEGTPCATNVATRRSAACSCVKLDDSCATRRSLAARFATTTAVMRKTPSATTLRASETHQP